MARANKVDSNQVDLVAFLRRCGGSWTPLPPGTGRDKGRPDGVFGFGGVTGLAEVKRPGEDPREEQVAWHGRWRGAPVHVWRTPADVLRSIGR